jgi:hypothetical protein
MGDLSAQRYQLLNTKSQNLCKNVTLKSEVQIFYRKSENS